VLSGLLVSGSILGDFSVSLVSTIPSILSKAGFFLYLTFIHNSKGSAVMATKNNRVGEGLPAVDLFDIHGKQIDIQAWKGHWTLLVFLRHLG